MRPTGVQIRPRQAVERALAWYSARFPAARVFPLHTARPRLTGHAVAVAGVEGAEPLVSPLGITRGGLGDPRLVGPPGGQFSEEAKMKRGIRIVLTLAVFGGGAPCRAPVIPPIRTSRRPAIVDPGPSYSP